MPILVIVRHGQSQWNLENRFTGTVDVGLTSLGEEEAMLAGQKLKEFKFDEAFTSVLRRARETLNIILKEIKQEAIPIHESSALNERNYGSLQGLNKAEVYKKYGAELVNLWRRSYAVAPPGGESLKDTEARVIPYYKQVIEPKLREGKTILLVAHGNSLRALVKYLENISEEDILLREILTGIPKVYYFDQDLHIQIDKYKFEESPS